MGAPADPDNIALLMARFERGEFDLVAVGRALLNEPEWDAQAARGPRTARLRRGATEVAGVT
jgi:2,4-dienoyl-CoA reductase-like NADH-dependent reductase (Old Yellow Enzyme family)